ncbi:pyridoxamine 5'-phosphate oxidase family protein [Aurantiacibacter spongiae]|uniref:Pyridoxamine 5'-phosphate oxidase n=1 Tax=Aurantiacibacter spongiae TaxID=2488860 RepID=A0A3N5CU28_9SPHN|nr:pyridoxamine 5'-phosphate oxidase family protein [Aurantiacibacter spongiae]RPF72207.1 pyridoxamine 5'-phosphate oxidase [Aurantiacibacter spongiae]
MSDASPDKSMADIAEAMKDIDFCMLCSRAPDGSIAGRPMSNNQEVEYEGTSWFFTTDDAQMVNDIARDNSVGLTYQGSAGLKGVAGAPGMFIHVEGECRIVRDKSAFREHWVKDLERWFEQGVDTPGLVMLEVVAKRIHYWDGEDEGEVKVPA